MRRRTNLLLSCSGNRIVNHQKSENIEREKRYSDFMRSGCSTAQQYLFAMGVRNSIQQFKATMI